MLMGIINAVLVVSICLGLGIFSYIENILDLKGAIASFFVGLIVGLIGDIYWLLALILYLVVAYSVTKVKYSIKKKWGVAQGKKGERGWRNVIANGITPVTGVLLAPLYGYSLAAYIYIIAISIASADSFASEIGVLSRKDPILSIPPFRRVKRGYDGGVSLLGFLASIAGAIIPVFFCFFLLTPLYTTVAILGIDPAKHVYPATPMAFAIPVVIGILGAYIDSILGAIWQQRGYLNNDQVNLLSIGIGILLAIPLYAYIA